MQFVLFIYHGSFPLPGTPASKKLSEAEQKQIYADYAVVNQHAGITVRLPPIAPHAATTVQVKDGVVHKKEGPYASEGVGGAFVLEAKDLDEAIALAAKIPQARLGGAVEIRPVEKYF